MNYWMEWMGAHPSELAWLAAISVLMFLASLVLVPLVVSKIPSDYFASTRRPQSKWANQHMVLRYGLAVVKNVLGLLLLVMGIAMLLLPGQGLLCILAGILLLDFPGKFRLERWLVRQPAVLHSINWVRRRRNRDPLRVEESSPDS